MKKADFGIRDVDDTITSAELEAAFASLDNCDIDAEKTVTVRR